MDSPETNLPTTGDLEKNKIAVETADPAENAGSEHDSTTNVMCTEEPKPENEPVATNHRETIPAETPEGEQEGKEVKASNDLNPLTENLKKTNEQPAKAQETTEASEPTKESILHKLKHLSANDQEISKHELDNLKQAFYKIHNTELEADKKVFIENGGTEETFIPANDPVEVEFKQIMTDLKAKRYQMIAELERQKEENLTIKLQIIDKLKELVESPEDTNKSYNEFKRLQQQWSDIKLVPQAKANEIWKSYQHYVEKFYDILKLNNEFRDYDFKKNLEIKLHLCEAAEKLEEENDVVSAFHQLQKLHQEFRETGPVAKELRDSIWSRFKTASTAVNKRHQQHFESVKEAEQHNLDQKTVICEIVEAIDYEQLKTFATWESQTQEIIALQAKWKTIGFAPQKMNVKIFERFRKACDEFFRRKGEFFRALKDSMNDNLEKKKQLCEQAEALKDSTDWKETAEILARLQKEWKTIGPVQKKHSDAVWQRFIGACDYFFEQKNKVVSNQRSIEAENLKKKKSIIEQLVAIDDTMEADEAEQLVRELMKEWGTIGHVPFKEKDKIYKQYHTAIDALMERLNLSGSKKKLNNFRSSISAIDIEKEGPQVLYKEREKLNRIRENLKNELLTYENNIGFLSASSQVGNSLVTEITKKVDKLKEDLEVIEQKIKMIDDSIREA